jgi:hypothetical protein
MPFRPSLVMQAIRWLHGLAANKGTPLPGGTPRKGYASYTEFSQQFGLWPVHPNPIRDEFLSTVVKECAARGWPDFAALVIHEPGTSRDGPGDGWYAAHGLTPGDLVAWRKYRDDCWARAKEIAIP